MINPVTGKQESIEPSGFVRGELVTSTLAPRGRVYMVLGRARDKKSFKLPDGQVIVRPVLYRLIDTTCPSIEVRGGLDEFQTTGIFAKEVR